MEDDRDDPSCPTRARADTVPRPVRRAVRFRGVARSRCIRGVGAANRLQRPCRRTTDVDAHIAAPRIAPRCRHGASRASDRATRRDACARRGRDADRHVGGRREHRRRRSGVRQPERAARQEGRALRRRPVSRARHCRELRRGRMGAAHGSLTVHHRVGHRRRDRGACRRAAHRVRCRARRARARRHRAGCDRRCDRRRGRAVAVAAVRLDRHHADRARVVGRGTRIRRRRDHRADVGDVGRCGGGFRRERCGRRGRRRRRGATTTGRATARHHRLRHHRQRRHRRPRPRLTSSADRGGSGSAARRARSRCRGSAPRRIRRGVRTRGWMHPKQSSRATSSC